MQGSVGYCGLCCSANSPNKVQLPELKSTVYAGFLRSYYLKPWSISKWSSLVSSLVHINIVFINYFCNLCDLVWTLKRLCFLGFGAVDKYRYLRFLFLCSCCCTRKGPINSGPQANSFYGVLKRGYRGFHRMIVASVYL